MSREKMIDLLIKDLKKMFPNIPSIEVRNARDRLRRLDDVSLKLLVSQLNIWTVDSRSEQKEFDTLSDALAYCGKLDEIDQVEIDHNDRVVHVTFIKYELADR